MIIYFISLAIMVALSVGALYSVWKKGNDIEATDLFSAMFISTVPVINTLVLLWIVLHVGYEVMKDAVVIKGKGKK